MKVSTDIYIEQPVERVWQAITDIENCQSMISGIIGLEVLYQPDNQFVGLKWKETRLMFGKEATETMWVTDAVENKYYQTRAESHGSVYISRLSVESQGSGTVLTMAFTGQAQSLIMKILSLLMTPFMKKPMVNMLDQDLQDIKVYLEKD